MAFNLKNIRVVLVEPLGEINLGSVARLCKNFGINQLRLVSPRCDPLDITTKKMALKGSDLLENAQIHSNLLEAIDDCVRVVATCGRIDHGEIPLHSSETALNWLLQGSSKDPIAIIFGREDRGLSNQELQLAQKVITLPSSLTYPSLNLSHAVAIILHDLIRYSQKYEYSIKNKELHSLSTPKELSNCLDQTEDFLLEIGFLHKHTSKSRMSKIKGLLQRAEVRSEEVALIRGILRQTKWFIDNQT
ncbi:RNA methyltransferase [Prochlorococcus marinus]|uniref:tRNA (cytidine/uridine-2'-O-)-methyltransferase TrmJ n=1 Tax=Prochlorococcus marinus (strain MIT 9211) TaxID=93059 RepID=A9BB53_PROM4|nr:RNA methyltransferase [Prochlorococcus marinus]ABX09065.1 probable tRNA/rRNA methyltransferase [Prochlorococcus marinus str. MIT 9211]